MLGGDPVAAENRRMIAAAVEAGFLINLSADTPAHADTLAELGISPVVTVLGCAYARRAVRRLAGWRDRICGLPRHTPAGRRIAICPATYTGATCKSCGACAHARDAVIGFPAHRPWRRVEAAGRRDVPPGHRWTFPEHRTMAQVIADEAGDTAAA